MEKNIFGLVIFFFGFISPITAQDSMGNYKNLADQILSTSKESDIICLGEHSHGDMNAIRTKSFILNDITSNIPTGVILFEAPLVTSVICYLKYESYSEFVWPFWRYKNIKITLDSIIDTNGLICLGFDPQETCNFSRFSTFLISEGYLKSDKELIKMDSLLAISIATTVSQAQTRPLTQTEAEEIIRLIGNIKLKLNWPEDVSETEKALISLCFDNRQFLAKEMTFKNIKDKMNFRDSIMALNINQINEIFKKILKQKKEIIWAANLHIAKRMNRGEWMMEKFIKINTDSVLSIGVIPRKQRKKSKRFDFAVVSGPPDYMSMEILNQYDCE